MSMGRRRHSRMGARHTAAGFPTQHQPALPILVAADVELIDNGGDIGRRGSGRNELGEIGDRNYSKEMRNDKEIGTKDLLSRESSSFRGAMISSPNTRAMMLKDKNLNRHRHISHISQAGRHALTSPGDRLPIQRRWCRW